MSLPEIGKVCLKGFKDYTLKSIAIPLKDQWVNVKLSTLTYLFLRPSKHSLAHHLHGVNRRDFMYNATAVYVNTIFAVQAITLPIEQELYVLVNHVKHGGHCKT